MNENNVEYLTIPEAAEFVGRTVRTLHNWNKKGFIEFKKGMKYGRSRLLIAKADMIFAIKKDAMNLKSVLPMKISKTGSMDEPLSEIIICDSISGGARYLNNMPEELSLVRKLADGTEYNMRYKQSALSLTNPGKSK